MSYETRQFICIMLAIPAIMIVTTVHEATRALISTLLGDDTPKREGRLTLNPLNHFEPIGFLLMYATGLDGTGVGVGWGKPAGTNSRHYKNRRTGVILTAVWPSVANILLAVAAANAMRAGSSLPGVLLDFLRLIKHYSISIVVCNLLPVSPFDCLKIITECVSRKNYFSISQGESVMQLIMILLLFSGFLAMLFLNPLYSIFLSMVSMLTF